MKSEEPKNIKEVVVNKGKRILLVNPKKIESTFQLPHNGLAILAAILKNKGHEVLVADYAFMREEQNTDISFFIKKFNPDVIGISIYTQDANEGNEMISRIHEINSSIPMMVGGPHATLYSDILQKDKRIDYIFIGESELTIVDVIKNAKKEETPKIIRTMEIVDINDIPLPDYKVFYRWESITSYPIMLSRGCPFQCSFCPAFGLSQKRWRARKVEDCIRELEIAKKTISKNISVCIMDDAPAIDKKRFYEFLELFLKRINTRLWAGNMRADSIDEKLLILLKKCGCKIISIGVEHAHPEVFKLVNKGETLEQIEKACNLIKKHKIELMPNFIIGLPGDNIERTKESIKFCRRIKAERYSINFIFPFRHTAVRKWFEENGAKLYNEIGRETKKMDFECTEPVVETSDFTIEERKKAWYMFLFGVTDMRLKLRKLPRIFSVARKYNLHYEFFCWLPRGILKSLWRKKRVLKIALEIYRKEGFDRLIKRYKLYRVKINDI